MSRLVLLLFFIIFISCSKKERYIHLTGQAQGTTFSIIYDDKIDYSKSIDSIFRLMDASMSLWDSTSTITKINNNTFDKVVDQHFQKVFLKATEISKQTNGYFDATVGPLVRTWSEFKENQTIPSKHQVDSLRNLVGYNKVKLIDGKILKDNPQIRLDFNALAQGYTVDVIAEFLEARGIVNYMVEVGGEVRAKGMNDKNKVWQIGIDKPIDSKDGSRPIQTIISLNNQSMATSGSYRKYVIRDGKKYSHAIDPLTGYPIDHNLLSITVFASDCMTADAYATAFLVMGLEKTKSFTENKPIEWLAVIVLENGELKEIKSDNFSN